MAPKPRLATPLTLKLRANTAKKVTKHGGETHYVVTTTLAELCFALLDVDHELAALLQAQLSEPSEKKRRIGFNCPSLTDEN